MALDIIVVFGHKSRRNIINCIYSWVNLWLMIEVWPIRIRYIDFRKDVHAFKSVILTCESLTKVHLCDVIPKSL